MIAVLLPTYNQAAFLPDALAGLASQTRRDMELIACDDGSTDGTADILRAAGIRTVTHETNRGTAAAINSAAALVGDNVRMMTWVSSDNVMQPRWMESLASAMKGNRTWGACYSAYRSVDERITTEKKPRPKLLKRGKHHPEELIAGENCYFGPSFLILREVWQEHRGGTAHDYDNWLRIEEACRMRGLALGYVPEVLCDYRHGDWNTVKRRPDLYDADKWRQHAIERRKVKRNWLGDIIADMVRTDDEVLDLGCGIMPATGGRLAVKRHLGVDSFAPYLDRIGPPSMLGRLPDATEQFADRSFDVALLLDVVEHLEKPDALKAIGEAERIARREVILFTPDGPVPQSGYGAWGMGVNPDQAHRCGFTFDELTAIGYECKRFPNGTDHARNIVSVLGVKRCD